jgi:hypothetical protein
MKIITEIAIHKNVLIDSQNIIILLVNNDHEINKRSTETSVILQELKEGNRATPKVEFLGADV